ncbi:unnamed protein product, partial [marine sediment metagenome]
IGLIIFIIALSLLTIGLINSDYLRINYLYEQMNFFT